MTQRRFERINEEFLKEISSIIYRMKDPRISKMVSVVRVDVARDLAHAKVFVSIFEEGETKEEAFEALKSAAGFMRTELSKTMDIRRVPQLSFVLDDSMEYAASMSKIIDEVIAKDENANNK